MGERDPEEAEYKKKNINIGNLCHTPLNHKALYFKPGYLKTHLHVGISPRIPPWT